MCWCILALTCSMPSPLVITSNSIFMLATTLSMGKTAVPLALPVQ